MVLLLAVFPTASSGQNATGHFEVYCDGVGFFLAKVDGAPAPGKLFLFLYTGFPGIPYVPKETWKDVNFLEAAITPSCPARNCLARDRI